VKDIRIPIVQLRYNFLPPVSKFLGAILLTRFTRDYPHLQFPDSDLDFEVGDRYSKMSPFFLQVNPNSKLKTLNCQLICLTLRRYDTGKIE
jgi:hypothetical protein